MKEEVLECMQPLEGWSGGGARRMRTQPALVDVVDMV